MKRADNFDHGFSECAWEAAKAEARQAMIAVAARRVVIYYSELVNEIDACSLEAWSSSLAHMLGEISTEEHQAGRGMLTAVVVRKHDFKPGSGFFKLACTLGYHVDNQDAFWVEEFEKVYEIWSLVPKT